MGSIGAKFWNFLQNMGGSIANPFFNSCPSSEYSSQTYIAYNGEHYDVIKNILPIVYWRNYDDRGVSRSSQPQNWGGPAPPRTPNLAPMMGSTNVYSN